MIVDNELIGLRIGNLVYDVTTQCSITITESNIKDETSYPTWNNNKVEFRLDSSDNYDWENSVNNFPKVKYIHQLQNIYFTLTETELL